MRRRLPFALAAIALSIPAVACLRAATDDSASSGADLDETVKATCNFGFTEVNAPVDGKLTLAPSSDLAPGQKLLFGDYNGDGKQDFAYAVDANILQVYVGKGDGTFLKGATRKVPNLDGRTRTALAAVVAGDFNGDKKQDVIVLATSVAETTPDDPTTVRGDYIALFGSGDPDGSLDASPTVPSLPSIYEPTYYQLSGDIDGDGRDEFVYTTAKGESVAFGARDRSLTPADTGFTTAKTRSLAFIANKSLILATPDEVASITFDSTHKATIAPPTTIAYPVTQSSRWLGTDLDQDGKPEITIIPDQGDLLVAPLAGDSITYLGLKGAAIGAQDLDQNGKTEVLFKVDDKTLFAACGYDGKARDIAATPLAIPYGPSIIVAGQVDLNGDKKPDFVTLDLGANAAGTVRVFLGAERPAQAATLQVFSAAPLADAGHSDASTDGGHDASADAGHDSGSTDAGHDSGADAGHADAGQTKPQGAGDDDDGTSEAPPPDDEGSGTKTDPGTKRPVPKPTSGDSTPTATVTTTEKPQAVDDCSVSNVGSSRDLSTSALGGLVAALAMVLRRRSRRAADGARGR
jgi:hypothetical protein